MITRSISDYENEIVYQIMIAELCFNLSKDIPIKFGVGDHIYPYLFNLNMVKGILILHSLLIPTGKEISVKNYIKENNSVPRKVGYPEFQREIKEIKKRFEQITPWSLRNKVGAHLDSAFKHTDFSCAYLLPEKLDEFIRITAALKKSFFKFTTHVESNSLLQIEKQLKEFLKSV